MPPPPRHAAGVTPSARFRSGKKADKKTAKQVLARAGSVQIGAHFDNATQAKQSGADKVGRASRLPHFQTWHAAAIRDGGMLASQDRPKPALRTGSQARRPRYEQVRRRDARTTNRFAGETPALLYPALGFGSFIKMRPRTGVQRERSRSSRNRSRLPATACPSATQPVRVACGGVARGLRGPTEIILCASLSPYS